MNWLILTVVAILVILPSNLEPGLCNFHTPNYPVVIMDTGRSLYILESPGGEVRKEVKADYEDRH